jgi:hypothetical protein
VEGAHIVCALYGDHLSLFRRDHRLFLNYKKQHLKKHKQFYKIRKIFIMQYIGDIEANRFGAKTLFGAILVAFLYFFLALHLKCLVYFALQHTETVCCILDVSSLTWAVHFCTAFFSCLRKVCGQSHKKPAYIK